MKRPTHIKIIKRKGEDCFRLSYTSNDGHCQVTSPGFTNRKQLAKIIKDDDFFDLSLTDSKLRESKEE